MGNTKVQATLPFKVTVVQKSTGRMCEVCPLEPKDSPFYCEVCSVSFQRKQALATHKTSRAHKDTVHFMEHALAQRAFELSIGAAAPVTPPAVSSPVSTPSKTSTASSSSAPSSAAALARKLARRNRRVQKTDKMTRGADKRTRYSVNCSTQNS